MSAKPCPDCDGPRGYLAGCKTCGGMGNLYTPTPLQPLALLRGGGEPTPAEPKAPNAEAVACLEALLAEAKAGKVESVLALIAIDGGFRWSMTSMEAIRALGYIEVMKSKLMRALDEREERS